MKIFFGVNLGPSDNWFIEVIKLHVSVKIWTQPYSRDPTQGRDAKVEKGDPGHGQQEGGGQEEGHCVVAAQYLILSCPVQHIYTAI